MSQCPYFILCPVFLFLFYLKEKEGTVFLLWRHVFQKAPLTPTYLHFAEHPSLYDFMSPDILTFTKIYGVTLSEHLDLGFLESNP